MSAVLKSPFDGIVAQIQAAPHYLSSANAEALIEAVRKVYPTLVNNGGVPTRSMSPSDLLSSTIVALHETIGKLNTAALTQEGGANAADLKKVVDAQEKQIKILASLSETLTANERQTELENAVTEALEECDNQSLKDSFLDKLHSKLEEKSKNKA